MPHRAARPPRGARTFLPMTTRSCCFQREPSEPGLSARKMRFASDKLNGRSAKNVLAPSASAVRPSVPVVGGIAGLCARRARALANRARPLGYSCRAGAAHVEAAAQSHALLTHAAVAGRASAGTTTTALGGAQSDGTQKKAGSPRPVKVASSATRALAGNGFLRLHAAVHTPRFLSSGRGMSRRRERERERVWVAPPAPELECSVCTDVFTDPVTLACGHTFCRACAVQWFDAPAKRGPLRRAAPKAPSPSRLSCRRRTR